jgi:hypothetical protein
LANVNCGWVGVGAKPPGGHECRLDWLLARRGDTRRVAGDECHLNPRMGGRGDIRRLAAARSRLLPSRR